MNDWFWLRKSRRKINLLVHTPLLSTLPRALPRSEEEQFVRGGKIQFRTRAHRTARDNNNKRAGFFVATANSHESSDCIVLSES